MSLKIVEKKEKEDNTKSLKLTILFIGLWILIFSSSVNAGIGFGMTDTQSAVVMGPEQNKVCTTYYLFNPGTVDIEGFLEVDRESGEELNKLLGLKPLYEELDILDERATILQEEYNAIPEGESTFEVEQRQAELGKEIDTLNKRIELKKPSSNKISIPAETSAFDENGNYQIPIDICFERPTKRYLLSTIGDTDFCGVYEGEVVGRYTPKPTGLQGSGSAVLGSRSTRLTVKVLCNIEEVYNARVKAGITIGAIVIVFLTSMLLIWKRKKRQNRNKFLKSR